MNWSTIIATVGAKRYEQNKQRKDYRNGYTCKQIR